MKAVMIALLALGILGCQDSGSKKVNLEDKTDRYSYMIGMNVGKNLSRNSISVNPDALARGITDASADSASRLMSDSVLNATLQEFQTDMQQKRDASMKSLADKNKQEADAFLAENKTKEGVQTLPSGLQYKVIIQGEGPIPKPSQTVSANYRGTFIDGTEFDASAKYGGPAEFQVSQVIAAWQEALLKMRVGSKWMLYAPPDLAYGDHGSRTIPPNSALIFEIELLGVK